MTWKFSEQIEIYFLSVGILLCDQFFSRYFLCGEDSSGKKILGKVLSKETT